MLLDKVKALESYMNDQTTANESLQHEVESLKTEITPAFEDKIQQLEEQLKNLQPNSEQFLIVERKLREIESSLDRKTKTLESIPLTGMVTTCSSPSEDVSIKGGLSQSSDVVSPRDGSAKVCMRPWRRRTIFSNGFFTEFTERSFASHRSNPANFGENVQTHAS